MSKRGCFHIKEVVAWVTDDHKIIASIMIKKWPWFKHLQHTIYQIKLHC